MKDRIEKIMNNNNLTASQFADKIGVTRSGLSHILSGRNKASLDYVVKIIEAFPETNINWLLTGQYLQNKSENLSSNNSDKTVQSSINDLNNQIYKHKTDRISDFIPKEKITQGIENTIIESPKITSVENKLMDIEKEVIKVILFYNDGTFDSYTENNK